MAAMAVPEDGFAASVHAAVALLLAGIRTAAFREMHVLGLLEGLNRPAGPVYLSRLLESALASIEARFSAHVARGEMRDTSPRFAALDLLAPLLVASLHQDGLGGEVVRSLELSRYAERVGDAFVRRYGV